MRRFILITREGQRFALNEEQAHYLLTNPYEDQPFVRECTAPQFCSSWLPEAGHLWRQVRIVHISASWSWENLQRELTRGLGSAAGEVVVLTPQTSESAQPRLSLEAALSQARRSTPSTRRDAEPVRDRISADDLAERLKTEVRGQQAAVLTVARRVARHLARVAPRRPATLFLIGPTGVGKTLTAQTLAASLSDDYGGSGSYTFVRLDMSEYQEPHTVSKLLGAPPGYIGYDDGAPLADALARSEGRVVVLFDEIEKAHPDVLKALMNAMDAGRLSRLNDRTTTRGYLQPSTTDIARAVDCRHAVFLFTTNLRAAELVPLTEGAESSPDIDEACRLHLRAAGVPDELIGRISTFAYFRPLTEDARMQIVELAIQRVADEYGLRITQVSSAVRREILSQTPENAFGARPLEYLVDDLLGEVFDRAVSAGISVACIVGPPFALVAAQRSP